MNNEFFDEPRYLVVKEQLDEFRAEAESDRQAHARERSRRNGHNGTDSPSKLWSWRALLEAVVRRGRASGVLTSGRGSPNANSEDGMAMSARSDSCERSAPGQAA